MKKITKILTLIMLVLICFSCSKGKKVIIGRFDNGKPSIIYYMKTINGKETKVYEEKYYPNDQLRSEGKCMGEKRLGVWKFYFDNGDLFAKADFSNSRDGSNWEIWKNKKERLVNQKDSIISLALSNEGTPVSIKVKQNGQEIFYRFFNSFKLMERWYLKGNIPQGEAMSWFEDGEINSIHYYKDGLQDSTYVVYSDSGQKIISGQYHKGLKVGKWEYFNSNGQPSGIEIYDVDGKQLIQREDTNVVYIGKDGKEITK